MSVKLTIEFREVPVAPPMPGGAGRPGRTVYQAKISPLLKDGLPFALPAATVKELKDRQYLGKETFPEAVVKAMQGRQDQEHVPGSVEQGREGEIVGAVIEWHPSAFGLDENKWYVADVVAVTN